MFVRPKMPYASQSVAEMTVITSASSEDDYKKRLKEELGGQVKEAHPSFKAAYDTRLGKNQGGNVEEAKAFGNVVILGFDPTADCLHVGHVGPLMACRRLSHLGYKIIILIGAFTAEIGDPSGLAARRTFLDEATIQKNAGHIEDCIRLVLGDAPFEFWNNSHWLKKVTVLDLFKQARKVPVQDLISGAPAPKMTIDELMYPLVQAFDVCHVLENVRGNCLQVCGEDEYPHMRLGAALLPPHLRQRFAVVAVSLFNSPTGDKYGKSAGNAPWLRASSRDEVQKALLAIPDSDLPRWLSSLAPEPLSNLVGSQTRPQQALADAVLRLIDPARASA